MSSSLAVLHPRPHEELVPSRRTDEMIRRGGLLRDLRQEHGRTVAKMAEYLDLSPEGYRMYEKGYVKLRQELLPKLALALDMPIAAVARRLELPLLHEVPKTGSNLAIEVAAILGTEKANLLTQIVSELAELPHADQQIILEGMRDQIRGRMRRQHPSD